jgi:NAD(P)-dependent dehydrogenase (short-subunit alcohol dehydrogenase family)
MTTVQFEGATAFITGGAQGIGFGIAQALARRGVKLALVDIDKDVLATAEAALNPVTPTRTYVLDIRDREAYARIADEVEANLGPVSLLFNNAGVATGAPAEDMNYEDWDWLLGINVGGVVNGIQTFVPRMIARGAGGYVVNTASGAGLVALAGYLYSTSKFAVVGMSESLHRELAAKGIGVSVLCPGPVATNIISNTVRQQAERLSGGSHPRSDGGLAASERFLARGTSPEAVGEMVIEAMKVNQLYIHTDAFMAKHIAARTELILDAMPAV